LGAELRQILALMGDQAVTIAAFAALFAYGVRLLSVSAAGIGRLVALLILGSSTAWLLLAVTGIIRQDLANWSPAAVILLAIGIEGRAASRTKGERRQRMSKPSETECAQPVRRADLQTD